MTETTGGRRSGGRAAPAGRARRSRTRSACRTSPDALKPFEVLSEEHLSLIEENADTVLEQVGIEFRDTPEALQLFKDAGADIDGERVRFPRGLAAQHRAGDRSGDASPRSRGTRCTPSRSAASNTVFAPAYGSPFVRDLDNGRRYGTIEDFRNFVKLDLHDAVPAPLGRHRLRARRRAGEQAALRHGLRAHALLGQGVHGLGDAPEPGRGHGRDGADPFGADFLEIEHGDRLARSTPTRRWCGTRRCSAPRRRTRRRTRAC